MSTKTKAASPSSQAKTAAKTAASGATRPKTSLNSAVTTDLPNTPGPTGDGLTEVDLSKATVKVPAAAITPPVASADPNWSDADEAEMKTRDNSFEHRVIDYGIGLVQVEGIDFRYVGVAPARDKNATAEGYGYPITPMNSRFTPLTDVAFHPSVRCKDAKTGEFYYPADGTTGWGDVVSPSGNPLVPKEAHKAAGKARREALKEARSR